MLRYLWACGHNCPCFNTDKPYIVMNKVPYDVIQKGKKITKKVT